MNGEPTPPAPQKKRGWLRWLRVLARWAVTLLEAWAEKKAGPDAPAGAAPSPSMQDDLFLPAARLIYSYYAGTEGGEAIIRKADPVALYKRVLEHGPEIDVDRKVAQSRSKDALASHARLVTRLRDVFNVRPYEQGGLTEAELEALLDHFLLFMLRTKKGGDQPQTPPAATGSGTQSTAGGGGGPPATPASSASGSAASGSSTAPPSP